MTHPFSAPTWQVVAVGRQRRTMAVRARPLTSELVEWPIFIGGPPQPPFWRRRVPWFDVLLICLLIAALVVAVHAAGGRFEIGQ